MKTTALNKDSAWSEALETTRQSFLDALRVRGRAASTVINRGDALRCCFTWLAREGVADVRAVTHAHVSAYLVWLHAEGYSEQTRHARLVTLRRLCEWLERTDAILVNPCAGIPLPTLPRRLPRAVLTEEQAKSVLAQPNARTAQGKRDRALLELFYAAGLRGGEMAALRLDDVDVKNGMVRVVAGKGGRDRVVPFGTKAAAAITAYVQGPRAQWSEAKPTERALWLGMAQPHRPLTYQTIAITVRNYARAAGANLPHGRTHLWRHTCATHLVARGANLAYVQRILGHASLETTQIYTRVVNAEVARTHGKKHPRSQARWAQPPEYVPAVPAAPAAATAGKRKAAEASS